MPDDFIHPSFAKGEISPNLYGRVDTAAYQVALRTARNCIIHPTGGVSNRPGTLHIGPVKDHTVGTTRLFDFQFNTQDQYILEFGDQYMRVIRNDAHVTNAALTITGITQADPAVVTVADTSSLSNDSEVFIDGVVGMTEVNNRRYNITVLSGTTFSLQDQVTDADIDSTGFTAYSSAGTAAEIFELATPYAAADLAELNMVQSADTITIVHTSYAPRDLTRTDHNAWSLDIITFEPSIANPDGQTVTVNTSGSVTVRYQVTALAADTFEESLPALSNTSETITGITQANPAVVTTSAAHGYSDFDEVEINSVVGMTELNGRRFQVNVLTATTFELIDEDSTSHTAYSSGGTSTTTFVRITNSGTTPDNTISWNSVSGAVRYAVYREDNGAFGLIGETTVTSVTDVNITADLTIAPPNARNPFLFTGNYPGAVSYYEQRQVYGGTDNAPDTTWYSRTGARKNMSGSTPSQADDAITATLNSRQVNEIRHFYPGNDLIIFTSGAEWRVNSGGDNAFEAATLRQKPQSEYGSGWHRPLAFGSTILFVEENNARVRSLGYSLQIDGYTSSDMNLLADHLLADQGPDEFIVSDWCAQQYPEPRLFIVRSDGEVLTMTFNQEQEVLAWTTWDTQGAFEACASLRKSVNNVEDGIYFIVRRIINGNTVRHIERVHTRKFADVRDAFFVDDGATFEDGTSITAVSFS